MTSSSICRDNEEYTVKRRGTETDHFWIDFNMTGANKLQNE